MVALDPRLIVREMQRSGWRSRLYEVKAGRATERVLMREVQLHPVSDKPLHVDFHRIAAGEQVRVAIAIEFTGTDESFGLKRGGVLNIAHHTVEVMVDPDRIPAHVTGDVSKLDIGDALHWRDLAGIEALTLTHDDADVVVATIAAPTVEVEPEPEAETEATGEAPAAEGDAERDTTEA